ncbi:tetratricopeptide repeat protein [Thermoflexibacter ruber]|uniref:Tetratricopeptide repeat-containing protein n=1 Tax=Thermoflexibacter ruber TaxID=1003 RepID=A0A1I2IEX5_9BACT|nr:tetratricopeptide repeat protein [Thermoflexibacter ruber]SFF39386.1 Tetratricopeptide repeat-containing protein [Thermoflexibacter ruber]
MKSINIIGIISSCFVFIVFIFSSFSAEAQGLHDGLSHYVDAERFRKLKQYDEALTEYKKALRNEPHNFMYLYGKALAEYETRKNESSLESLESLFKLKHDYAPAYVLLAQIYRQQGNDAKALACYDSAAKFDPEVTNKIKYKSIVMQKYIKDGDFATAYEKAKDLHSYSPKDLKAVHYLARLANMSHDYQNAINSITAVESQLKDIPANEAAKYYYELGFAYFHINEYTKAHKAWEKAKVGEFANKIEQYSGKHFLNVATIYHRFRNDKAALHYIDIAEKIDKSLPNLHLLKAQISKKEISKKNTELKKHLETIIRVEQNPANKEKYYAELVELYFDSEEYEQALAVANAAIKHNPNDLKQKYYKALALHHKGAYKEAETVIQEVLKSNGNPPLDFVMLHAFNAKSAGNSELAKQTLVRLLKSPYRAVAEIELKSLKN